MEYWEYETFTNTPDAIDSETDILKQNGWEEISADDGYFGDSYTISVFMKRRITEKEWAERHRNGECGSPYCKTLCAPSP